MGTELDVLTRRIALLERTLQDADAFAIASLYTAEQRLRRVVPHELSRALEKLRLCRAAVDGGAGAGPGASTTDASKVVDEAVQGLGEIDAVAKEINGDALGKICASAPNVARLNARSTEATRQSQTVEDDVDSLIAAFHDVVNEANTAVLRVARAVRSLER